MGGGVRGSGVGDGAPQGPNDEETLRRTDRNEIPGSIPSEGVLLLTHTVGGAGTFDIPHRTAHTHTHLRLMTLNQTAKGNRVPQLEANPDQSLGPPSDFGFIFKLACSPESLICHEKK